MINLVRSLARGTRRELTYHSLRAAGTVAHSVGIDTGPLRGVRSAFDRGPRWRESGETTSDPSLFELELARGTVFSDYGVVISSDRYLIHEVAPTLGRSTDRQLALYRPTFPHPRRVAGRVALLSSVAHQRYFHWLFDILPRLEILSASSAEFDSLIVNRGIKFQAETLDLLGITRSKLVNPAVDGAILAETLIVPSLPGHFGLPTRRSLLFLQTAFGRHLSNEPPFRKVYVTRNDAATRRVRNENEILDRLSAYGFERVSLEGCSVVEQIRLFSEAQVVVGPHGGGLSNVVFMKPNSRGLIELMPSTYEHVGVHFQRICSKLSLPYARVSSESYGAPDHDMRVQFDLLRNSLAQMLG